MAEMKPTLRLLIVLIVTALGGCAGAIGFEIALEFDRYDIIPRDYKMGLWVCDTAFLVGTAAAAFFGYWA